MLFLMNGGVTSTEMSGKVACDNAMEAIQHSPHAGVNVRSMMCVPKSAPPCAQDPKCSALLPVPDTKLRANPAPDGGRDR